MAYIYYNPNPKKRITDDCVIRAICKLTNTDWYYTYAQLSLCGFKKCDWGSCNEVWSSYLRKLGYRRELIPNTCPAGCCASISVKNTSVSDDPATTPAPSINMQNANLVVEREA